MTCGAAASTGAILGAMAKPSAPTPLPIVGQPPERSDAAANRERILCAARSLLVEQGAEGLSMNAVAASAGVGKGTIFRRFGDRDGLTAALLDAHTAELQDAFLSGPPPLGPGAPPRERLAAFLDALVRFQFEHLEIVLAAERVGPAHPPVYATFLLHLQRLVEAIDPDLDAPVLAGLLFGSVAPPVLRRLSADSGADVDRICAAAASLAAALAGSFESPR